MDSRRRPVGLSVGHCPLPPPPEAMHLLAPGEAVLLADQQAERRRQEFTAGRTAARQAIRACLGARADGAWVDRLPNGAPIVRQACCPLSISITHGHVAAYAAVVEGEGALGVDLCEWADAPRVERIARRAFPKPAELALTQRSERDALAAWALKEAVAKALRIGMLEDAGITRITILSTTEPAVTVDAQHPALELWVEECAEGLLAFAFGRPR